MNMRPGVSQPVFGQVARLASFTRPLQFIFLHTPVGQVLLNGGPIPNHVVVPLDDLFDSTGDALRRNSLLRHELLRHGLELDENRFPSPRPGTQYHKIRFEANAYWKLM